MPYIKKEFATIKGKKIEEFLISHIPLDSKLTLALLEKGKITDENNKRLQKNQIIKSDFIYIIILQYTLIHKLTLFFIINNLYFFGIGFIIK